MSAGIPWWKRWLGLGGKKKGRRGYDGAAKGRHTDGWLTTGASATAEVGAALPLLRERSRDLARNNPYGVSAIGHLVTNLVGEGIQPRPATGDKDRDELLLELWQEWCCQADTSSPLGFYGMQSMAARAWFESGEALLRRRPRRMGDGLTVPLQLQLLEGDMLDLGKTERLDKGRIVQGIEFDALDRRRAYWLLAEHPGEQMSFSLAGTESKAVAASEIAHLYEPLRPGQVRGVPWMASTIRAKRDLDDYAFAERTRKKVEASVTAFVFGDHDEDADEPQGLTITEVKNDKPIDRVAPGLIVKVLGGQDVKFNQPATVGGYAEYKRAELQGIAAGDRVPYELLTGDLTGVNYSSIRTGLIGFRRQIRALQALYFIPMFCQPVWRWFTDMAIASGELEEGSVKVRWIPPRFEAVDRLKEAMADIAIVRGGFGSLRDLIAEQGGDPSAVLTDIAETAKLLDELGLVLDSDPRRTAKSGGVQAKPVTGLDDPE